MTRIDRKPVAFERWIFRWILVPAGLLGVALAFGSSLQARHQCRSSCAAKGFTRFDYTASQARGVPSRCDCSGSAISPPP